MVIIISLRLQHESILAKLAKEQSICATAVDMRVESVITLIGVLEEGSRRRQMTRQQA